MKQTQLTLLLVVFYLLSCGKQKGNHETNKLITNYTVMNIDTIINYNSSGEKKNGNYKIWSTRKIEADIIINNLPKMYDQQKLNSELEIILKEKKVNSAYIFRDVISSIAFRMSSMTADSIIKSRNGYLGHLEIK